MSPAQALSESKMRGTVVAAPGPVEPRHRPSASTEETNKRKSLRSKLFRDRTSSCKFPSLKIILITITFGTFVTLLNSPAIYTTERPLSSRSGYVDGLMNESSISNQRYTSHLDINWEQISRTTEIVSDRSNLQGIGLLNFNKTEIDQWQKLFPDADQTVLHLDHAPHNLTWETLYPEWIDEEEDFDIPICLTLPKIQPVGKRIDLVAVKLPCNSSGKWWREVGRFHLQLEAGRLASMAKGYYSVHVLFVSDCFPIPNLFSCKDLVRREGNLWLYEANRDSLRQKVQLPVGSCELSVPLKAKDHWYSENAKREAYATILHSAHDYVCGAIAVAQSIRMSGSTRDLVILVDATISDYHRRGLEAAGWKVRTIDRIRNPKAVPNAYNEWNYSKFRLWQLTDYDKIIFIDADLLILRNIDFLFEMPEISATGNNATLFNSGVMVIEPSNCTFDLLMAHVNEIESYNGGDQGYLNEIFTWWHRIPKHMNFLKYFWEGDPEEVKEMKTRLFSGDPPAIYVLHYLGMKPWLCFRDYDCNWNEGRLQGFASDVAHRTWWRVHDAMPENLQRFCLLRSKQKAALEWNRREAEKGNFSDGHWKIKVKDVRLKTCFENFCFWESMLWHWGDPNWTATAAATAPAPPLRPLEIRGSN